MLTFLKNLLEIQSGSLGELQLLFSSKFFNQFGYEWVKIWLKIFLWTYLGIEQPNMKHIKLKLLRDIYEKLRES